MCTTVRRKSWRLSSYDLFVVLFLTCVCIFFILLAIVTCRLKPDERNELFSSRSFQQKSLRDELEVEDAKFNPCKNHYNADLLFLTSITRPFRDHAKARKWKDTIWEDIDHQDRLNDAPLWVFNENTWEIAHGRLPLSTQDFPSADCVLDVFDVLPKALRDTTAVDEFYDIRGTPGLNERIMDGKVLMRKVAAIAHTLGVMKEGSVVVWIDVDVVQQKPLDNTFLDFIKSKDVSYLPETLCWRNLTAEHGYGSLGLECLDFRIDTGVVAFLVNKKTRTFAEWWIGAYSSAPGRMLSLAKVCLQNEVVSEEEDRELVSFFARSSSHVRKLVNRASDLCSFPHIRSNLGLNDIYTFALALHSFGAEIEHGWIAYKHSGCKASPAGKALPGGYCHPCASEAGSANEGAASLISSFRGYDYLFHVKGGTGIMARQHTDRDDKDIANVMTVDEELLLPALYVKELRTHIDHRLACGDKRGVYGKVWSLSQLGIR